MPQGTDRTRGRNVSDQSQGPGWWMASDDRWYPPEQHPDYVPPVPPPPAPTVMLPPTPAAPVGPPLIPTAPGKPAKPWYKRTWVIVVGVILVLGAIGSALGEDEPEGDGVAATADPGDRSDDEAGESTTTRPRSTTTERDVVTTPKPTTTTTAKETVSQRNARSKADAYLDMSGFSRSGLIEQLEFEGFSEADATYGADAVGADWNEQAARKAEQYLDMTSFSRSGLIEQLKFEGFSQSEAEYGVSTTGL